MRLVYFITGLACFVLTGLTPLQAAPLAGTDAAMLPSTQPVNPRQQAIEWLNQAGRFAEQLPQPSDRTHLCAAIAIQYARCGDLDSYQGNMHLAGALPDKNPESTASVLRQLRVRALPDIARCMASKGQL